MIAVQARSGSTRWPGKIYEVINGKSILRHVYDECMCATSSTHVIGHDNDIILKEYCKQNKIPAIFGSSENDVLGRFVLLLNNPAFTCIVRTTADCPFISKEILYYLIVSCGDHNIDFGYYSCAKNQTIPDGWDCEYMTPRFLQWLDDVTTDPADREHVTAFAYKHPIPDRFRVKEFSLALNLSSIKASIDTREDFARLREQGMVK